MNQENFLSQFGHDEAKIREYFEKIIVDPPEEFWKLESNAARIRFCYERLQNHNMIVDRGVKSGKNEELAIDARNLGNHLFINDKDFVRALEEYNKSICLTPVGSDNIGICYANRSAIYFETGLYKICMENIDLALSHNYPEKLKETLEMRRRQCLKSLKLDNFKKFIRDKPPAKLSYKASKKVPFMIEGLEFKSSKEFGRHICAKRNLFPGDIVIVETPYIKCTNKGSEYTKCNNCHQSNFLSLFPCEHCTEAMYCGKNCKEEAWNRFHQYECKVIETDVNRLIVRATLISFTLFNDCDKLRTVMNSAKKKPVTAFDLNYKNLTEEDSFRAIYCLATNSSKRSMVDIFKRSNILAQSWHMLKTHTNLCQSLLKTTDDEDLFLDTLLHFSQVAATNSHELRHVTRSPADKIDGEGIYSSQLYGSALFPLISLLNHSCAANVYRVNSYAKICIMVVRPIKPGEQLFDNYGCDHTNHTKEQRKEILSDYLFNCQCEACQGDYPLLFGLKKKNLPKFQEVYKGFDGMLEYDMNWAYDYFHKCKRFLKEFGHHYPSNEVCGAQCILNSCRKMLFENTPLELQLKPHEE